jgi:glycine cleavage system H protein
MQIPDDLRYAPSHEWCRAEGDLATIGITDFAQDQLGDVVYLELPSLGAVLTAHGEPFGTIESVKAASDLYSPVSGEVVAVNTALERSQEAVNTDPYGSGWLLRLKLADPAEIDGLLDAAAYAAVCEAESN